MQSDPAQGEYERNLSESRKGIDMTSTEFKHLNDIVSKEIKQDCENLEKNNTLPKEKIQEIINFFKLVRSSYDVPSKNARITNRLSTGSICESRIKNQLCYQFGNIMIKNFSSIWNIIRLPYMLKKTFNRYKLEQKAYNEKIKANPNLKLPPLESYPDYAEAMKIKNHLSYKLGEALIKAHKSWYKGGYIKLWFDISKIKKEHKNKKANSAKI